MDRHQVRFVRDGAARSQYFCEHDQQAAGHAKAISAPAEAATCADNSTSAAAQLIGEHHRAIAEEGEGNRASATGGWSPRK